MNVCLANDSFPPTVDGVSNAVVNYALQISRHYGNAAVATPRYPGVVDDYPFDVVRYSSLNTTRLVGYRAGNPFSPDSMRRLQEFRPDIIHSHCPIASTFLARELRELTGAPIVFTYHTKFDIDIKHAMKMGFLQELSIRGLVQNISACDEVWAVSRGAGENLRQLGYEGEYRIMPNGVDLERSVAPQDAQEALNRRYRLRTDCPVFLFVGRMMWYKGLRIILDALAALKADHIAFQMVFVGDSAQRPEIEQYARDVGVADACIFTGVEYDRSVLKAWYSRADLFLFPSTFDTNGLTVREAAACSLASVLVRDSCAAEDVTNGVNSLLIEENAASMAQALRRVCREPAMCRTLGQNAARDIYCSWEDSVHRAAARYGEIIRANCNGELPRKRAKMDGLIEAISDVYEGMERMRRFRIRRSVNIADRLRGSAEKSRENLTAMAKQLWEWMDWYM